MENKKLKKAIEEGFDSSGVCIFGKDEEEYFKRKLKEFKEKGFKTIIIRESHSGQCRRNGPKHGVSTKTIWIKRKD